MIGICNIIISTKTAAATATAISTYMILYYNNINTSE
jgi:hypothetical protein